jgi:colanic acid biosynthesis glycosyl transferase WcaI
MKKRILLISYNFSPELTGIGKYNGEMINWLAENGYDCTVITTYPYYPYWKVQEPYSQDKYKYITETKEISSGGKITVYRCPMYVPTKPSGMKRILLDFSFLLSAAFKLLQLIPGKKFDCVVVVVPSFQVGLLGVLYKRIRKAKLLYHIQDLQIEAARDLQMIKSEKLINLLFKLESYILNNSDVVSSISQGMVRRISEKVEKNVLLFPNWTDTSMFYPILNQTALKIDFGFQQTDKIILYSGAIGEKQGLEAVIYAADEFRKYDNWKFLICGSGPYREKLQSLAKSLDLRNVVFVPLQPLDKFNNFLNIADVHLIIQKANASDLVMPSKLTTVLSVGGLALITANDNSGLHALVKEHEIGLLVEAENQEALNEGIKKAILEDTSSITKNARSYAESHLSIEKVMKSFQSTLY